MTCFINDASVNLISCVSMRFPVHINTLQMGMSIIYLNSSEVGISNLPCTYIPEDFLPTVKPVYNSHSQKDQKLVFKTNYHLMQVKSKGSILQYFQPSLSYHLSLSSLFCLFLSGGFTQVLLYTNGADIDDMPHFAAFYLDLNSLPNCSIYLPSLPKYSSRSLVYK